MQRLASRSAVLGEDTNIQEEERQEEENLKYIINGLAFSLNPDGKIPGVLSTGGARVTPSIP